MDLTGDAASPGDFPGLDDHATISVVPTELASARMFRSLSAGRAWLRARGATALSADAGALVTMKAGDGGTPLFMVPGAGGSILQLGPLAAAIPDAMPVYATRPRGHDGVDPPHETIREMAEYAIAAIRPIRPTGPYLLLGYSAGGLVALEMAQLLTAAGHAVPFVGLIDTYPARRVWPLRCHAQVLGRQALRALWALRAYSPAGAWGEMLRRLRSLSNYLVAAGVSALPSLPVVVEGISPASRRVYLATYNAGEAYQPARYDGKVTFIQPDRVLDLEPRQPQQVWRLFLGDLDVRRVAGTTHDGFVDDGAAATAATILECLSRAGFASQPDQGSHDVDAGNHRR